MSHLHDISIWLSSSLTCCNYDDKLVGSICSGGRGDRGVFVNIMAEIKGNSLDTYFIVISNFQILKQAPYFAAARYQSPPLKNPETALES